MTQPPMGEQPPGFSPPPGYGYPPPGYGPPGYGPPGYGYPPPGYGYGPPPPGWGYPPGPAGPPQEKPSTNIGWAIAAIFTFWPLAIPAFIYSGRVDGAWNAGDRAGAESASHSAKQFGLIAVIVGAVLLVLLIVWFILVFAFIADVAHNFPTYTFTPGPS